MYREVVCRELVCRELVCRELVCRELVCREVVCRELVCRELVCREVVCRELVCRELVCREVVCRELCVAIVVGDLKVPGRLVTPSYHPAGIHCKLSEASIVQYQRIIILLLDFQFNQIQLQTQHDPETLIFIESKIYCPCIYK